MYVYAYVWTYGDTCEYRECTERDREAERDFVLRNLFIGLWGLASPKSPGQVRRVETQGRVSIAA